MKKVLSIIMALSMLISSMALTASADLVNPFEDVPSDAWYHDEVVEAVNTGIINGKSATIFAPDDLLTYAEAIKLAACMNQVYTDGEVTLSPGEPWYKPFVDYCKTKQIITKEYNYNENVTRSGYMEIFANALPDEAFADINNIPDGSILDVKDNAPYAIYVYKLYRAGIVTGVDELHNCNPDDNIKRSEVAAIISRMMNEDKRVKFDMTESKGTISNEGTIDVDEDGNKTQTIVPEPTDKPVISDVTINTEHEAIVVGPESTAKPEFEIGESPILQETPTPEPTVEVVPGGNIDVGNNDLTLSPLTIYKQPEGYEAESYGEKYELEVQVFGGKAPYSYQWFYYTGYRNSTDKFANGDYVKDVTSDALVLSIEKENTLLGKQIYCEITDSEGTKVKTDAVKVYGPFSMPVDTDTINVANKEYVLAGRIADGVIRKGDKVSVERNGKIIATGTAIDLQMFNKSLDEGVKDDNIGIVFEIEKGVRPQSGDIVIKYKDFHVIDTSDIVN